MEAVRHQLGRYGEFWQRQANWCDSGEHWKGLFRKGMIDNSGLALSYYMAPDHADSKDRKTWMKYNFRDLARPGMDSAEEGALK